MKFITVLTSLHLNVFTFLLLFFSFSLFATLSAQVIIKERIEIMPGESIDDSSTIFHKFIDDNRNPYYLRYGGYVSLNFLELSGLDYRNFLLGEEEIGIFGSYQDVYLGPYPQWQKLYFTLTDPDDSTRHSPDFQNIVNINGTLLEFNPSRNPGDPYPFNPDMAWSMELQSTDSSLAVIPPEEILNWEDGFGNPFAAPEYMTPYDDGVLYLIIKNAKNNTTVDLYIESPQERLLQANVSSAVGDTIGIGEIIAWDDLLRFYVKSNNPVVGGMKMYPAGNFEDFYMRGDGVVHLGDFLVEDWTDQTFDDMEFEVIMTPYDPDYFTSVEVTFSKEKIKPGDTVDVALWDKNNEEAFPQDQLFDVVIVEGAEYAAILDITSQDTLDSFDDILQGFKIIAAESIGTDSVTVRIKVGYLNDIIIFTKSVKDDEKIKPNAHAEYEKKAVKSKNSKTTNPTMAKSTGGVNNNIEAFDEDNNIGFGSVVIKNTPTFYAEAEPDTITQGDISQLVFKRIEEDGTLTPLPAEQRYSLSISGGSEYGTIYSYNTNTTADQFTNIAGLFEFRAEEIIEEDSVYVEIIVTPEENLPAAIVKSGGDQLNNVSLKEAEAANDGKHILDKGVKQKDELIKVTGGNTAVAIESDGLGNAKLRILITKGNECGENAPKCVELPKFLGFKMETTISNYFIKEGFLDEDLCLLDAGADALTVFLSDGNLLIRSKEDGNNYPIKDEYYLPYVLETCYREGSDGDEGGWQYKIKTTNKEENFLYINAYIAFCDRAAKTIYSISELEQIEDENICQALIDFELERYRKAESYDPFVYGDYSIADVSWEHEKYHVRDYGRAANKALDEKTETSFIATQRTSGTFRELISNTLLCSDFIPNFDKAQEKGKEYYGKILNQFVLFLNTNWNASETEIDGKIYKKRELYAHWSDNVQRKIDIYQKVLADRLGESLSKCDYEKDWSLFVKYKNNL